MSAAQGSSLFRERGRETGRGMKKGGSYDGDYLALD
jgi:hypothetical protein